MLTPDSIGPLRAGQSLGELLSICPDVYRAWDWGAEGIPTPVAVVRIGEVVVEAVLEDTLANSRIYSLVVSMSSARTPEGLGPGSAFGDVVQAYGAATLYGAECELFAVLPGTSGMSWRLDIPHEADWGCEQVYEVESRNAYEELPEGTVVRWVAITTSEQ